MSNVEIALHCLALTLIGIGLFGRLYFGHKAAKARKQLLDRWWAAHDDDIAEIKAGKMTAEEAGLRRRLRHHP
jgi:hypothetical protein